MMNLSLAILSLLFCYSCDPSAAGLAGKLPVLVLRDAPRADHLDVLVHEAASARAIAHFDERGELPVNIENTSRHLGRQRRILRRPGDVLERNELNHEDAIVRSLGDSKMKFATQARERRDVSDAAFGTRDKPPQA